ncbi:hypothetical protein D3C85_1115520 [compost metagenome]
MKSSKLKVNASRKPAMMAGLICGRVTRQKVAMGGAYRSAEASCKALSRESTRLRTMTITRAMVNSECAAITVKKPMFNRGTSGSQLASSGLIRSNRLMKAISVEMPMTMPGMMIAQ